METPVTTNQEQVQVQEVVIDSIEIGTSPNGVKFGKIGITKKNGERILVLAKGDGQFLLSGELLRFCY